MFSVKDKTGFDDGDIKCLKILKGKIVNDLTNGLDVKFQNAKAKYPLLESMIQTFVRGKEALKKIAEVLNKQNDISIMVEGHTDNKPYISSTTGPVNSNWDLSVMRATSITKIILNAGNINNLFLLWQCPNDLL